MSSVEKGDRLEDQVHAYFSAEIKAGRFLAKPSCCTIFKKKGYYSKDRGGEIIFDVSVEIRLPGQTAYSILYLLECKNYDHRVPVDDVEEFFTKAQQVAASNCKAVIVSTNTFQSGALKFAASKGVGLLRFFGSSKQKWSLLRTPALFAASDAQISWRRSYDAVAEESFSNRGEVFCGLMYETDGNMLATASLYEFFASSTRKALGDVRFAEVELAPAPVLKIVRYVPQPTIAQRAQEVLNATGYSGGRVSLESVCEQEKESGGLLLRRDVIPNDEERARGILGRIEFSPLEIITYAGSRPEVQAFTLAHELGHWFMGHREYMRGEFCEEVDLEPQPGVDVGDVVRLEWQANQFASCLLLPQESLLADVRALAKQYDLSDRGHGLLFVDDQPKNLMNYYTITDAIRVRYGVSRTAVTIRLAALGVLTDARKKGATRLGSTLRRK